MPEPLLLIHGFTDTARTWTTLLPLLEPHHEVLAPTTAGHSGGPAMPADCPDPIAAMADELERTLDTAGHDKAHLVGNSLGGWLAFELAARGRALSVVALSPASGWEGETAPRETVRVFTRSHRMAPVGKRLADTLASRPGLRRIALRDVIAHPERVRPDTARELMLGNAECAMFDPWIEPNQNGDYRSDLDLRGVPVRIAWGARDRTL